MQRSKLFLMLLSFSTLRADEMNNLARALTNLSGNKKQDNVQDPITNKYSWFFTVLPEKYHQNVLNDIAQGKYKKQFDAYENYLQSGGTNKELFKIVDKESNVAKIRQMLGQLACKIIAQHNNGEMVFSAGYCFFYFDNEPKLMLGKREFKGLSEEASKNNTSFSYNINIYKSCIKHNWKEFLVPSGGYFSPKEACPEKNVFQKYLTGLYKIHLMPQDNDVLAVVDALIEALKHDSELRTLINKFKVSPHLWSSYVEARIKASSFSQEQYMPVIVIYAAFGKDNVQKLLEKLLVVFKDFKGADHLPRYNTKVNGLIYYAQADADYKLDERYFYDSRYNYAVYRPDFKNLTSLEEYQKMYGGNEANPYVLKV